MSEELDGATDRLARLTHGQFYRAAQAGNLAIDAVLADIKTVLAALKSPDASIAAPSRAEVIGEIAAERERQKSVEGWTAEHDDQLNADGQLALAAACYALPDYQRAIIVPHEIGKLTTSILGRLWPWAQRWWKPSDPRRDLIKAGALIVAEIERLGRALSPSATNVDSDESEPAHD